SLPTGRRTSAPNADPGSPKLDVAEIAAKLDGKTVRIDLNLLFDNARKETAATYRLREGEIVEAPGLPEYGIAPFTLKVVIAKPLVEDPTPTDQLQIANNTGSLEILRFEKATPSSATYQLEARNISNKNILSVDFHIPDPENRSGAGQTSSSGREQPLIRSGEVWKTDVSIGRSGRTTLQGFVPQLPRVKTLIVRAIIFDDGSYEGDPETVAAIEAVRLGRQVTYQAAIGLLEGALQQGDREPGDMIKRLKEGVYAIPKEMGDDLLAGIFARFPSLSDGARPGLKFRAESTIRNTKEMVISQIQTIEESLTRSSEVIKLQDWLALTIENFRRNVDFR
ncbi:MAG TPA: hypothetical protein VGQ19_04605, partial [Burkholderiales bacterium]|nr:hypothetical protein [Burkholderiales bacterium]